MVEFATGGKKDIRSPRGNNESALPPHTTCSFFCISSKVTPLVSGYTKRTTKNCTTIMAEKNMNGMDLDHAASVGNANEIAAFISQCDKLPRLCPLARTRLGNTSLR